MPTTVSVISKSGLLCILVGALAACSLTSSLHAGSSLGGSSSSGPSARQDSSAPSVMSGDGGASSHGSGDGPQSNPETWKRWAVRGIELGMPRSALVAKGFTCGKRANSRCYKLMDKRCETGSCEFREDAFGQWFELNGAKTDLDFMTCGTTETDSARISSIRLYFAPRQLLTPDSVLGKAMTAKYGKPSQVNEPEDHDPAGGGSLRWFNADLGGGGPQASADCSGTGKKQCQLTVEDDGLVAMERAKQAKIDKQHMHDSQPKAAPEL